MQALIKNKARISQTSKFWKKKYTMENETFHNDKEVNSSET